MRAVWLKEFGGPEVLVADEARATVGKTLLEVRREGATPTTP
jgi:hypothetical protein